MSESKEPFFANDPPLIKAWLISATLAFTYFAFIIIFTDYNAINIFEKVTGLYGGVSLAIYLRYKNMKKNK